MEDQLRRDALEYHRVPIFGKTSVTPTNSLVNQRDLAFAYSPGVAYACLAIKSDLNEAPTLTSRANLIAVISNRSAVLGLGDVGANQSQYEPSPSSGIVRLARCEAGETCDEQPNTA